MQEQINLGIVLGPVVLAITLGLLQTFKQDNDEAQDMGAQLFFAH